MNSLENRIIRIPGIEKWAVDIPCYQEWLVDFIFSESLKDILVPAHDLGFMDMAKAANVSLCHGQLIRADLNIPADQLLGLGDKIPANLEMAVKDVGAMVWV